MQHVGPGLARAPRNMPLRRDVAHSDVAAHRHAGEAEREVRGERREGRCGAFATGRGIGHDADLVAARRLTAREIEHVAEQAADRRPQDVENLEGAVRSHAPSVHSRESGYDDLDGRH